MSESEKKCANDKSEITEEAPIVTSQQLELGDQTLAYRATVGMLPLKDEKGAIAAQIFYTAYTLDADANPAERPLIFVFNGGPGSASIWLHMGALGPKRVDMGEEGFMPPPPYKLIDNAHTWLDLGDLVFIDPVGTGYSRAADPADNEKYWGLEEDLEAVGEFIRLYLSREKRWTSPLYLAGESYGTTRAAGLAGHLIDRGIAFNGVVLISTVMNFQTLRFTKANDLPYTLYLPSFCAAAHYHGKLEDDLQKRDLRELLREVAEWAEADYTVALAKGDRMSEDERASIAERLSRYTGLSQRFILGADLRVNIMSFCKELLRDDKRAVGRLDSRFIGIMASAEGASFDFDPSMHAITPPYNAVFNQYVREQLAYETDLNYEILSYKVNENWRYQGGRFPDTSEGLRAAFAKNPFMRVLVAQGYYDLATPFQAAYYSLAHMGLDPALRDNITITEYEAGHMMYVHEPSLAKLKADARAFIRATD
ncbi:MAG: peptidase S10 [Chloroflexota bacterium]|nr:peptidase S10 [Chloroflexota bacterium]MDE2908668.1 peptidase S10 [Chloroflexota bacterium]